MKKHTNNIAQCPRKNPDTFLVKRESVNLLIAIIALFISYFLVFFSSCLVNSTTWIWSIYFANNTSLRIRFIQILIKMRTRNRLWVTIWSEGKNLHFRTNQKEF